MGAEMFQPKFSDGDDSCDFLCGCILGVCAAVAAALVFFLLAGCSHPAEPSTPAPPPLDPSAACAELGSRVVDLYVAKYASEFTDGGDVVARRVLREVWEQDLRERGVMAKFTEACLSGITRGKYDCALAATDTDAFIECLREVGRPG